MTRTAKILIVAGGAACLFVLVVPNFIRGRTTAAQNACISNLRQLDAPSDWPIYHSNVTNGLSFETNQPIVPNSNQPEGSPIRKSEF